ncbi:hypothetical protein FPV67DRAFT_587451 [Lyophyllum atratum]|nr:hypothetical protein FPV67DRAFT_587451 [Lyophyllum atratum]
MATETNHNIAPRVGSGPDGQTLSRPPCGNTLSAVSPAVPCKNSGSLTCSKCHLARYCSRECQAQHWNQHRIHCKGILMSASWRPAWETQNRTPAFIEADNAPIMHHSFGLPYAYLWGNLPAIDCLNLSENEHLSALRQDFKFCFAASGDIRNLVRTVNGLPDAYQGKCDILFNDWNPLVVGHNLVVLWALLNPQLSIDDAAELALHIMYSSSLTYNMSAFLSKFMDVLDGLPLSRDTTLPIRGRGKLHVELASVDLRVTKEMLRSRYGIRAASHAYSKIMCNRKREDYTDRHLTGLEPSHRLAFSHYRSSGILGPFSLDLSHFEEPNRLLYSPDGDWLMRDSDSPLHGWDLSLAFEYGAKHGVERADVYGCLFFYVKDELVRFATRLRDCDISLRITMLDANDLPRFIERGAKKGFSTGCFDRIETSNLADYASAPRILRDWGPCLNRRNKYAVLLVNFMNWQASNPPQLDITLASYSKQRLEKYASIMGIDFRQVYSGDPTRRKTAILRFMAGSATFADDYDAFQSYLQAYYSDKVAALCDLRMRKIHRIHPIVCLLFERYRLVDSLSWRAGVPLTSYQRSIPDISKLQYYNTFTIGGSEPTTRFLEFEARS